MKKKRRFGWKHWFLLGIAAFVLFILLLGSCSTQQKSAPAFAKSNYTFIDSKGTPESASKSYLAKGKSVQEVAHEFILEQVPNEQSPASDEKMVLVYDSEIVTITRQGSEGSLVQVDTIQYVQENIGSSSDFFTGYLTSQVINSIFSSKDYKYHKPQASKQSPAGSNPSSTAPNTSNGSGSFTKKTEAPAPTSSTGSAAKKPDESVAPRSSSPATSSGSGSFTKKSDTPVTAPSPNATSSGSTDDSKKDTSKNTTEAPTTSSGSGSFTTKKESPSSPSTKPTSNPTTKPTSNPTVKPTANPTTKPSSTTNSSSSSSKSSTSSGSSSKKK